MAQTMGGIISISGWASIFASFTVVIAVNILAVILPMKLGFKRLSEHEV
jgi:hypothetical protein